MLPEFWRRAVRGDAKEDMKYEHNPEILEESTSEENNETDKSNQSHAPTPALS